MKRIMPALFLALIPLAANAGGNAGSYILSSVQVDSYDGLVAISGPSNWANPDGCGIASVVVIQMSNPYYRDLLATVLTASATGKTVTFYVVGCASTNWGGTAPIVDAATIN
jgi:hypothetical protein